MATRNDKGQFVKGHPGGPGRPKRRVEEEYLHALRRAVSTDDWSAIIGKAVDQAKRGDSTARKWLADYLIGAPIQRTENTGADGGPLKFIVTFDGEDEGGGEG